MAINPDRKIITYENIALFQSDSPAHSNTSNSFNNVSFLPLVQGVSFGIDIPRTNVGALGSKDLIDQSNRNAPDVLVSINTLESFGGLLSSLFNGSSVRDDLNIDRNFYATIGSERGLDVSGENLGDSDTIAFGNCFLTDVSMSQSINGFIDSTYSFVGSNLQAQRLQNAPSTDIFTGHAPSIDLTGQQIQDKQVNLFGVDHYYSNSSQQIIPSYSTHVSISGSSSSGGFLIQSDSIQSFDLNLPINRKSVYSLGKKYPVARKALFPIVGTFNFANRASSFEISGVRANLKDFLNSEESYTLNISGQNYGKQAFNIQLNEARFQSQGNSLSISQELNSELSFNFDINKCEVQLPSISGSLLLENSSHLLLSDGNFVLLEQG
jgi:hypothetical protein